MTRLLLLDCDGTIREPLSGATFIQHPRDQRIIEGADKALAHYISRGWAVIGITNQGGVAAGHKSLEDAINEQCYTLELFPEIKAIYFCPDFEGRQCWRIERNPVTTEYVKEKVSDRISIEESFRKPGCGMLKIASEYELIHLNGAWYVGDRPEDEQAAAAAGVDFMWADIWRDRFRSGIREHTVTPRQLEFLEDK